MAIGDVDAALLEVFDDELDKESRVGQASLVGVGEKLESTRDLTSGVLDQGQAVALDLRPQLGYVIETLGVEVDLFEELPAFLDLS